MVEESRISTDAYRNTAKPVKSEDAGDTIIVAPPAGAAEILVQNAAEVVQLLALGSDLAIDRVIFELDNDPQWETAVTWIAMLSSLANLSSWAIGDILYFLRMRWSHETVAIFTLVDGKFPEGLYTFVNGRFNVDLRQLMREPEILEFIGWTAYTFPKFWLLSGFGEVRVWGATGRETPTTDEWEQAISESFTPYINSINDKTAWALYAAAVAWPRSRRREDVHFTAHLELRHRFARDLGPEWQGDERHKEAGRLADQQMTEWEEAGVKITTNFVRQEKKRANVARRGFEWGFPPPPCLTVRQTGDLADVDPTWYCAVKIGYAHNRDFFQYLAFHMGLIKDAPTKSFRIVVRGDKLIDKDTGEVCGVLDNTDQPVVDQALTALFKKLRWNVDND